MGMGDAADNAESVCRAVHVMTDRSCFGLAPSKITISTVGPTPESFGELAKANTVLAWSVHAARDDLRKQLVPTTRYTMEELSDGLVHAVSARTKRLRNVMLEITLIDGLNDSITEARELAVFANNIKERVDGIKLVVNLIPFNDIGYDQYQRAKPESVAAFQKVLIDSGIQTYIRTTRGDEEHSACGQLATKKRKILEA
jgi:23S rRNA (adenine2503-C2)-methyltransferase